MRVFSSRRTTIGLLIVMVLLVISSLGSRLLQSGMLIVINETEETICYVYISPVTDDYWGDDWLGSTETIPPGGSRNFAVSPGEYDLRVDDCDHNELGIRWGVPISGTEYWAVGAGGMGGSAPPDEEEQVGGSTGGSSEGPQADSGISYPAPSGGSSGGGCFAPMVVVGLAASGLALHNRWSRPRD